MGEKYNALKYLSVEEFKKGMYYIPLRYHRKTERYNKNLEIRNEK